jgi:hypothetical protein
MHRTAWSSSHWPLVPLATGGNKGEPIAATRNLRHLAGRHVSLHETTAMLLRHVPNLVEPGTHQMSQK